MKTSKAAPKVRDPYEKASFLSRITFGWVNPIIKTARDRTFSMLDHDDLSQKFNVFESIDEFERDFDRHRSLWRLLINNVDGKVKLVFINLVFTMCEIGNVVLLYFLTDYLKNIKDGHEAFDKRRLGMFFGLMILSSIGLNVLETVYDFLLTREFIKLKNNFTMLVIKYILKINMHANSETSKGNLINLIQIDCAVVEEVGYELVLSTYIVILLAFCFFTGFYLFGLVFGAYIGCSLLLMIIAVALLKVCMRIDKEFMVLRDDRLSVVSGILSNIRFVKFNVLENYFTKIVYDYRLQELSLLLKYNLIYACTVFIDWITPSLSKIVFIVVYFVKHTKMTLQAYMAFLNLDSMISSTFISLPWVFMALFRVRLAFHRIGQFLKIQPFSSNIIHCENQGGEDLLETKFRSKANETENEFLVPSIKNKRFSGQSPLKSLYDRNKNRSQEFSVIKENADELSIEVNNVNFSYFNPEVEEFEEIMDEGHNSSSEEEIEEEDEVELEVPVDSSRVDDQLPDANEPTYRLNKEHLALRELNIDIRKGELVFIIGGIGSGKSSFLYSLMGELNQIFSDNIAKKSSKGDEYIKINGTISFCPQKPFILTKTVRENILFYEEEDRESLERAVRLSFLEEDIASFDNGIDKMLIENGMNLSGGQRSRINLARCLYRNSDIYLLDSPFSALDFDTSRRILEETIVKSLKGKTRVIITHNIQFLKYADRIISLKRGKIVFSGNFTEFSGTQFYRNYRTSIKFHHPLEGFSKKTEISLRKRSMSKSYIELPEQKLSTKAMSHTVIAISKEEREYFKGFLSEDRVEGREMKKMFRLIFKYYGGFVFLLFMFLACLAAYYMLYVSSLNLYDSIEKNETSGPIFWANIKSYIILNVAPALIAFFRVVIMTVFSMRTSKALHQRMIFEVLHADLCLFHDKIEPARIINRFSNDYDSVDFYISSYIDNTILLLAYLGFEIYVTKEATSIYLVGIFVVYFVAIFYYQGLYIKARKDLYRLERIGNTPIINLTDQIIEGSVVIKVFRKQMEIIKELSGYINENSKNTVTIASLNGWFDTRLSFINIFVVQALAFAYILIFNEKDTINTKQVEIFISLIIGMIMDSKKFMHEFCTVEAEIINLERCDALLRIPLEKRYLNLKKDRDTMNRIGKTKPANFLPLKIYGGNVNKKYTYDEINDYAFNKSFFLKGEISMQAIFAKYPLTIDYVLQNVKFELKPGEKLGIIGKTGSGKSTILKLLLQYFTPEKGKIIVDGYDITKIDAKKLRSEFLVISQEITLFEGSLRDNLIFENAVHKTNHDSLNPNIQVNGPRKGKSSTDMQEPLLDQNSEIEPNVVTEELPSEFENEVISKLIEFGFSKSKLSKKGLDLEISNNGGNLSIGEQQLISFFKAFFTKKKIIFLDEATAPFDYLTQQKLIDYFNSKIKGKTVISVAHKIMAIAGFDKILMLDQGLVVEYGFIKELMANENSYFRTLIDQYTKY
jgi:ABC-type multidrug transport system fused ATPase/permease subunit